MPEDELAGLERELREAAAALDPVPDGLRRQAEEAFTWRTIDAELAALAFDSAAAAEPALVRGEEQPRLLTFRTGELSIEVEVSRAGRSGQLVGRLVPAQPAALELQRPGGRQPVTVDPLGRFHATPPLGPVRLRCRPATADSDVVTDWFAV